MGLRFELGFLSEPKGVRFSFIPNTDHQESFIGVIVHNNGNRSFISFLLASGSYRGGGCTASKSCSDGMTVYDMVILKIIKHCTEFSPALVTGQLLGLDVGSVLEVTNCFPFPIREEDEEIEADGANYQLEMMRCLREVNVDNNTVGWYQSTLLGSYQTVELIEIFMNYQENIRRCVCIIYDPSKSNQGVLALKALKLSDSFMELYRNNEFNGEKSRFQIQPLSASIINKSVHVRNMEFLIDCMDDLSMEQQKFQFYYRNLSRQQAQQQTWLQKRRAENMARNAAGEEPLPEEDPSNPIFKPLPEPSRLDSYLTNQVSNYCNQINSVAGQSFSKLYLMKALH
ncbi:hypothetical protein L1987_33804 [Smallanthus sonchifolius]|uniref:Uncharacterized protein n=1 Tax=Smallanthus sonchifolius TaxID=185202 RepID=A0ACB9HSG6_9ASTR|nr:hypothetical protein L1987_33804 [Smallanthus sonchifolius]